jgi:hypothetical protein
MGLSRLQRERKKWWSKVSLDGCDDIPICAIGPGWIEVLMLTPESELQKARDRDELARKQRYTCPKNFFPCRALQPFLHQTVSMTVFFSLSSCLL